ncbi:hypothetical protein AQJ11_30665 [Streptomyces corchorusii]|uniref:Uncharacterized protein n=1 Tax=Streptomyces corchorusii TaxID=1903 RepID=A0A101PY31_STRCK|nr:hypothetical protein AQJ11_30665 [Streptomyces corchorusii]
MSTGTHAPGRGRLQTGGASAAARATALPRSRSGRHLVAEQGQVLDGGEATWPRHLNPGISTRWIGSAHSSWETTFGSVTWPALTRLQPSVHHSVRPASPTFVTPARK